MLIPVPKKEYPKYESGVNETGLVYAEIDLISVDDLVLVRRGFLDKDKVKQVRVNALVDSGAYNLSINETVRAQLDLPFIPMEDMDVLIDPRQQKLMVNSKHPYVVTKHLK